MTIYPEEPVKIDLLLDKSKIEASSSELTKLNVELKDRYNNLVFNDSTTEFNLEILDKYNTIISSSDLSDISNR